MFGFLSSKRFWTRATIGFGFLVGLFLIANAILSWRAGRRYEATVAAIRAVGDPASIAELAPRPIPEDENAAVIIERIEQRLDAFSKDNYAFYTSPIGEHYEFEQNHGQPHTAEQLNAIRAILDKYTDVDRALAKAAQCEKYASQLDFSLHHTEFVEAGLRRAHTMRTAAFFLLWQMDVVRADRRPDQEVMRGIELLRLARLYESEPGLMHLMVAMALRGMSARSLYDSLSAGPISQDVHAALDEELARHDDPARIVRTLKSDRAVIISNFDQVMYDMNFDMVMRDVGPSMFARWFIWSRKNAWSGVLNLYEVQLALASRPWDEVRGQIGYPRDPQTPTGFGVMADSVAPTLQAAFHVNARNLAVLRALRIFNALRQYSEQNGHDADGLVNLNIAQEATIDPYSSEPLKLKQIDDGWVIYSVMQNGKDDGGDFKDLKDYGVAPPGRRDAR